MKRLVQILLIAIWITGAVVGSLPEQPSASAPADESLHWLIDTDHARLGVDRSHVVLAIETPWRSEWRVEAPIPARLAPNRCEESRSSPRSESAPRPSIVPSIIRALAPRP